MPAVPLHYLSGLTAPFARPTGTVVAGVFTLGEDRAIIVLYQPEAQTYEFACANFFGACLGMGTDNDSYNPELKAKPCTDWDGLPLHESTRKKGMCQAGAAYKAINGTNAGDILRYYYDNCNTFYCVME